MLSIEPVGRVSAANHSEITLVTQLPENVARTNSIRVVHFYQPVLMSDGNNQAAVIRAIDDGVSMSPVRKSHRPTITSRWSNSFHSQMGCIRPDR